MLKIFIYVNYDYITCDREIILQPSSNPSPEEFVEQRSVPGGFFSGWLFIFKKKTSLFLTAFSVGRDKYILMKVKTFS